MRYALLCIAVLLSGCIEDAYYSDGTEWKPAMSLLENDALKKHPILRRLPKTDAEWTRWIQTLDAQKVVEIGAIVLSEYIRLGQTAFDTGTGFWLGDDGGTPKISVGNSAGNKLTWNGTTLSLTGQIDIANSAQTFTPTWGAGFSADPAGDLSYLDLGAVVILWTGASMLGTSDDTGMTITNLPAAIQPASGNRFVPCHVVSDSSVLVGAVNISGATMTFYLDEVIGTNVGPSITGFDNTGSKGLAAGFLIVYPQ